MKLRPIDDPAGPTHIRPNGRPPSARNCFGAEVLVEFPALCGAPTFGIRNIEVSFAEYSEVARARCCRACLEAAGLAGQLALDLGAAS